MSQHDFDIANQTASNARADLNNALQALASLSSGSSAPSTTYPNMLWYDTGNNILKMRTEADDAWIDVGYLCQSTNKFCIFDDTNVVNSSGTQVGLIGDQPTSDWEAGTSTTESLVSPEKVKAAIDSLVTPEPSIGVGQTWQNVTGSRNVGTTYTNNTGKPILVGIRLGGAGTQFRIFVDSVNIKNTNANNALTRSSQMTFIVPSGSNYGAVAISGFPYVVYWAELR